jgi:hypothetical protein|tara:strand:- start:751 stop:1125 length:375 start_codon:yes stop_codon:yes gene_type:complete
MTLNEDTFVIFAAKCYDMKKVASVDEFYDDLKRIQYVKRLFKRYDETGELKTRLILNHMIVLYNCFGASATPMIFMKLHEYHKYVAPFALMLNYMPDRIEYGEKKIISSDIPLDNKIIEELRKI